MNLEVENLEPGPGHGRARRSGSFFGYHRFDPDDPADYSATHSAGGMIVRRGVFGKFDVNCPSGSNASSDLGLAYVDQRVK